MSESPFVPCVWQVVPTPHRYEATAEMGSRMSSPPGCKPFRPDESEEQASELIPRGQEQECEDRREAEAQVSCRAGGAEPGAPVCRTPGGVGVWRPLRHSSAGLTGGGPASPLPQAVLVQEPSSRWPGLGAGPVGPSTSSYALAWERGLIRGLPHSSVPVGPDQSIVILTTAHSRVGGRAARSSLCCERECWGDHGLCGRICERSGVSQRELRGGLRERENH